MLFHYIDNDVFSCLLEPVSHGIKVGVTCVAEETLVVDLHFKGGFSENLVDWETGEFVGEEMEGAVVWNAEDCNTWTLDLFNGFECV